MLSGSWDDRPKWVPKINGGRRVQLRHDAGTKIIRNEFSGEVAFARDLDTLRLLDLNNLLLFITE
jgi:hypothetical protein